METTNLTVMESYNLHLELNGVIDPGTGSLLQTGILKLPISLAAKFKLRPVSKIAEEHYKEVEDLRLGLIKEWGVEGEDGLKIPEFIQGEGDEQIPNPKLDEFNTQLDELLKSQVEYRKVSISADEFKDIKSELEFPVLGKYLFGEA